MAFRSKIIGVSRDWLDVRLPLVWPKAQFWFENVADVAGSRVEAMEAPARTGYTKALRMPTPPNTGSVSILGGHPNSRGWSMFSATGSAADWGHDLTANAFNGCQANRIDSALDFQMTQASFDRLFNLGRSICRDNGARPHPMGEPEEGRTLYFNWKAKHGLEKTGNEKAPQFSGRLYEKGKQMGADPDWRRWEVTCRPDKGIQKERAFSMGPAQLLGVPVWSRALLEKIGYVASEPPPRAAPFSVLGPVNDDAKVAKLMATFSHMGEQYGSAYRELVALVGQELADDVVRMALRPVVLTVEGRTMTGPEKLRHDAQRKWADVFVAGAALKQYRAGSGAQVNRLN